ncbi:hypothetical protein [uncultured Bilophila sp.]|uniref:hypothetical protein n=1 Tax=uncultured Bilophila sp. TaxID=529385 RepID=UPI0026255CF7|nr:hypothetical protein [uncultured Bilophila sp.]
MGKPFQTPQGLRTPVSRFKNNLGQGRLHNTTLSGNTKFFLKIITDVSDYIHGSIVLSGIIKHRDGSVEPSKQH